MKRPTVLILGGGFAGLACANALDRRRFSVRLVDARRAFEFLPNIHELVSGVKRPAALRIDLRKALTASGHRFVHAEVRAIDAEARAVELESGRIIDADYLVIALGAIDADYGVSGVAAHALGFKSVSECKTIHERLENLANTGTGRVAIIGGGLEGIEALGEILRRYRGRFRTISLIEAREQLLPGTPGSVDEHLMRHCERFNVEVITGDAVARITPKTVVLSSRRRLRSDVTIWTGGPAPTPLLYRSGLAPANAWAPVSTALQHRDYDRVFVAGDAAAFPTPLRKQAYHALDMGVCVAANIERCEGRRRLRAFKASPKPTLVSFGDVDTLLLSDRLRLAGPGLASGKEAVYAAVMAGLDRRGLKERSAAVLERGTNAARRLLWPALREPKALLRLGTVRRLP